MALKRKVMRSSSIGERRPKRGVSFLWGVLILICKVLGIAFLVQGFILQLATGILYYGMLHYAIGAIFGIVAWHLHKNRCQACCK